MSKQNRSKAKSSSRRMKKRLWNGGLIVVVLGGLATSWFLVSRDPAGQASGSNAQAQVDRDRLPSFLRDRMVLPAQPRTPRPRTLYPENFDDPEVRASYRAAKEAPEALEKVACYCGCYASSGHRNNLDCFTDNHGVT